MGQTNIDVLGTVTAAKAATFTVDDSAGTFLCDATAAPVVVNLPLAASAKYRRITVKKIDASANAVTLDGSGAETIEGAATLATTTQYKAYTVQSDGTTWWILSAS